MVEHGLSLTLVGGLISGLGFALLGVFLWRLGYLSRSAESVQRAMVTAVALSSAWGFVTSISEASEYTGPLYAEGAVDAMRYAAWLWFLLMVMRPPMPCANEVAIEPAPVGPHAPRPPATDLARALTVAAVMLMVCAAGAWVVRVLRGDHEIGAARYAVLPLLGMAVLGLVLVEQVFRNLVENSRWAAKPLALGLASVFAYDVYLYTEAALLGRLDPDARSVRPLVHLLLVPFLFIVARRAVDWSRSLQVSRRAVFYSAALLLAGAYLLFIAAVGYYVRYFGGDWGRALQMGLAFAGVVLLFVFVFSASLRASVRVFIGKHFFSYRYDYREEWLAFTATLASDSSPQEVGVLVIRALANVLECPAGSLWTRGSAGDGYNQVATWNLPPAQGALPATDPLVSFLRDRSWVIDLDEHRRMPHRYDDLALPAMLTEGDRGWAIIPLPSSQQLLGWVLLARPRTPVELDWETRDLLKTASRQAAGYLAQMQATEALLESRKFDAFNRMSAFVVHDLKNIVTQLSLMMKNARRLRDNPEFQEDMLLTVESSLEKMRRMMLQLREGVAPPGGTRGVSLTAIIGKLEVLARNSGRTIEAVIAEDLSTRGHEDRLERVLGHLVQNALDATPSSGRVWVRLARHSGQALVEIGDTGRGMSDEFVRTRLFKPFSSTKSSGMGIGSYESAQYIRELGGAIQVNSQEGRGTVLTVLLPLFDVGHGADLPISAA